MRHLTRNLPSIRKLTLLCFCAILASLPSTAAELANSNYAAAQEIVHDISEFDSSYQNRARAIVESMMSHYPEDSYIRWRPVRIDTSEVLRKHYLEPDAMPISLWLSPFPDVSLFVQQSKYTPLRYSKFEYANGAIWEGYIDGNEHTRVRITVVGSEHGPSFVIVVSDPPRKYSLLPTDDRDVYVAIELRLHPDMTID